MEIISIMLFVSTVICAALILWSAPLNQFEEEEYRAWEEGRMGL